MIRLTHTIPQLAPNGFRESNLEITVLFDPEEKTVDRIQSVRTFNLDNDSHTDITAIMIEHFEDPLNDMVDSIDWWEKYREYQEEKEVA